MCVISKTKIEFDLETHTENGKNRLLELSFIYNNRKVTLNK